MFITFKYSFISNTTILTIVDSELGNNQMPTTGTTTYRILLAILEFYEKNNPKHVAKNLALALIEIQKQYNYSYNYLSFKLNNEKLKP